MLVTFAFKASSNRTLGGFSNPRLKWELVIFEGYYKAYNSCKVEQTRQIIFRYMNLLKLKVLMGHPVAFLLIMLAL